MGFVVPCHFHVRCTVMFSERKVEHLARPHVEHGFLANRDLNQAIHVDRASSKIVPVAAGRSKRTAKGNLWGFVARKRFVWNGKKRRPEGENKKEHQQTAFHTVFEKTVACHSAPRADNIENPCSRLSDPLRGSTWSNGHRRFEKGWHVREHSGRPKRSDFYRRRMG